MLWCLIFLQVWSNYEEPKEEEVVEEPAERVVSYRNILVTEVQNDLKFYAQTVENGRNVYHKPWLYFFILVNSFLASSDFCSLLITEQNRTEILF